MNVVKPKPNSSFVKEESLPEKKKKNKKNKNYSTNPSRHKQGNEPIRIRSNYM